ncbi:hypothetical protein DDE18_15860 [Nocardioides gansuensis]|uniref:Uncharacterized protein n=1 Tax=Nocardioides gansuensis TaxID=2138300 RepID=A0A2T8F8Z1_9ACTN|nr:hypothetical protein [Nocardioides gansuensis]PVG82150.1 hypothetical protein DDE18_15860 [Nocardioides gansuensis]
MRWIVASLTLALTLAFTPAAPAAAAGEVVVTMPGGVLYDPCGDYPFTITVAPPPGHADWWVNLVLTGPDGNEADTAYVDAGDAGSTFFLCEDPNLPGTYTITGSGTACNADYDCVPITATPSSATFRLPMTITRIKARPRDPDKGQPVRFIVTSRDERPAGYFGTPYASVKLQSKRSGAWRTVPGTKTYTNDRGRAVIRARYLGGRVKVRAVTASNSERTGSTSRTITFR